MDDTFGSPSFGRLRLAGVRESGWASGSESSDEDSASDDDFERGILAGGGSNRTGSCCQGVC